jgi:hypothetical protein
MESINRKTEVQVGPGENAKPYPPKNPKSRKVLAQVE